MPRTATLAEAAASEVRAEMGRQGISNNTLATRLDVSDLYLSRRLRMEQAIPFNLDEIAAVASALGKPVEQFLPVSSAA